MDRRFGYGILDVILLACHVENSWNVERRSLDLGRYGRNDEDGGCFVGGR